MERRIPPGKTKKSKTKVPLQYLGVSELWISRINELQKRIAVNLRYLFSTLHHLNSLLGTSLLILTSISANCYKKQGKHCRLLPATLCLSLKVSLPTAGSPEATVKPITAVSNPAGHRSQRCSQAAPSKTLNILTDIRFSSGQMFFTSEAVYTHTQVEIWNAGCIKWWWQLPLSIHFQLILESTAALWHSLFPVEAVGAKPGLHSGHQQLSSLLWATRMINIARRQPEWKSFISCLGLSIPGQNTEKPAVQSVWKCVGAAPLRRGGLLHVDGTRLAQVNGTGASIKSSIGSAGRAIMESSLRKQLLQTLHTPDNDRNPII